MYQVKRSIETACPILPTSIDAGSSRGGSSRRFYTACFLHFVVFYESIWLKSPLFNYFFLLWGLGLSQGLFICTNALSHLYYNSMRFRYYSLLVVCHLNGCWRKQHLKLFWTLYALDKCWVTNIVSASDPSYYRHSSEFSNFMAGSYRVTKDHMKPSVNLNIVIVIVHQKKWECPKKRSPVLHSFTFPSNLTLFAVFRRLFRVST